MEISAANSMNVLLEASKNPRVQAAEKDVEFWKGQLDKVDLSLSADREQRSQLEPQLYEQTWAAKSQHVAQFFPLPFMAGLAGTLLAVSAAASALPALQPFKGLLAIGSLVAYWKFAPKAVGSVVRNKILPPMVDKAMKENLQGRHDHAEQRLQVANEQKETALRTVTDELFKKIAEEQAAKGSAEVHLADEWVTVNGIRVPRKAAVPQPAAASDQGAPSVG